VADVGHERAWLVDFTLLSSNFDLNALTPVGITIKDVFEAISYNFSLHVSAEEFGSWDERRQAQAGTAYWNKIFQRQAIFPDRPISNEGLKRVDYLGDRVMFRGLEPSPRMDGTWMLFVGPI
jgi:hypothetical protein